MEGYNGSGRFRLPLPASIPQQPRAGDRQDDEQVPEFLPFRHPPPHQRRHAHQPTSGPGSFDPHQSNAFKSIALSLDRDVPPQHLLHQPALGASVPNLQGRDRSFNFSSSPRAGYKKQQPDLHQPVARPSFPSLQCRDLPFDSSSSQRTSHPQQQPDLYQLSSPLVGGDTISSPAAQAALRTRQRNTRAFGQDLFPNAPVTYLSSPNVPVVRTAFPSFPAPNRKSPVLSFAQRPALPQAPTLANGIQLINPKERIPDRFQPVFPYDVFNAVQSKCFNAVYTTNDNVVVSAPTGSGKTVLLELAICKLVVQKGNDNAKIVYIAPTKALCKEKAEQWSKKFATMDILVSELTGDTSRAEMRTVREARIIVTTPEKWDSITRSWKDHRKLLDLVELFLIDEVHILKETRGATLEAVVSRMKTYGAKVRFVALSATVPNSGDIAKWLGKGHQIPGTPAHQEVFGEQFRPVKLQKIVHGIEGKLADHPFDKYLNSQLWKYLEMHTEKKATLVFCMTRKSCRDAAEELAKQWSQRQPHARLWPEPTKRIPVIDAGLQELVRYGIAFHHAGLEADDRKAIHKAFEEGHLSVICCTSTLAVGVNLPCHTVVLKGTVCYQDGGQLGEYSDLEVMQMLGRAGRPQYEDTALAIILTRSKNKKRYEELESGQQILESTLHKNLIEHVNSEISLGTFRDTDGAKLWLGGTFLSVRLHQNPHYYGDLMDGKSPLRFRGTETIEEQLAHICEAAIETLRDVGLITGGAQFQHTEYGRAMSKYMVHFETMKKIVEIARGAKTKDLLSTLCEASEFKDIRWQTNERDLFRDINKDPFITYPIEGNVTSVSHKVSLLVQMELGRVELNNINGFERQRLRGEARRVLEVMHRLIRAVIECKGSDSDGPSCWAALEMARSLCAKAWEGRPMQLLQVPQLGPVLMRKLVTRDIRTVHQLQDTEPADIERIANRNPPFGKKLKDSIAYFPRLTLAAAVKHSEVDSSGKPVVHVDAFLGFSNARGKWQGKIPIVTFLALTNGGVSAHFCRESLKSFKEEDSNTQRIHFTWNPTAVTETLICRFACEEIVGTVVSIELQHNFSASNFSHLTKRKQTSSAEPQTHLPVPTPKTCSPIEDDIDDDDMLGLLDGIPHPRTTNTQDGIESDIEDDDIFESIDGDGNFPRRPVKRNPETAKKAKANDIGGHDHQASPRSVPSLDAVHEKADFSNQSSKTRESYEANDLAEFEEDETASERPIRLPNGRYKCRHPCSQMDGGTAARSDRCGHECCRNGSKHPPRKHATNRKRKERAGDIDIPDSEVVPDFSRPEPPLKRVRASDASKAKAKVSSSTIIQPSTKPSSFPASSKVDLSLYDVDDEGLFDLTQDYDSDMYGTSQLSGSRMRLETGTHGNKQAGASKPATEEMDMMDNLSDLDFLDMEKKTNGSVARQRVSMSQKRKQNMSNSDEPKSLTWLEDVGSKNKGGVLADGPDITKKTPNKVSQHTHDSLIRKQIGTVDHRQMKAVDILSPLCVPSKEVGCGEVSSDMGLTNSSLRGAPTMRKQLRRVSKPLVSSASDNYTETSALPARDGLEESHQKGEAEPGWVNDFDPDFISEFRGLVDFI